MRIGDQHANTIYNVSGQVNIFSEPELLQVLDRCEPEVVDFIDQFGSEAKGPLLEAKEYVKLFLLGQDEAESRIFITRWQHPYGVAHDPYAGIAGLWKMLILCHVSYTAWRLDTSNITRNLLAGDQWRRAIYSCWNQQTMPKIIIHLASRNNLPQGVEPFFPHRLIILNSDYSRDSMCRHCGHEIFPFERILKDFGRDDEYLVFKGADEGNNFKILESVEVYGGDCIFSEAVGAADMEELAERVRSVL